MPAQQDAQRRRDEAKQRLDDEKKKVVEKRKARRAQFSAHSESVKNIAYIMIPQSRKHLGKLIEKTRKDIMRMLDAISSTPDAQTKQALKTKIEDAAKDLAGMVRSAEAKAAREANTALTFPAANLLAQNAVKEARIALPVPSNYAPPTIEAAVMIARMIAASIPRRPRDTDDAAFLKVKALTQRALARMVERQKTLPPEHALSVAVLDTLKDDPLVIAQEVAAGGLRADPAADTFNALVAPIQEDFMIAVEDHMRAEPSKAPEAAELNKLLKKAKTIAAEVRALPDAEVDMVVQDLTLASLPVDAPVATVYDEDFHRLEGELEAAVATPFYMQPMFIVGAIGVAGLAYYMYSRRQVQA